MLPTVQLDRNCETLGTAQLLLTLPSPPFSLWQVTSPSTLSSQGTKSEEEGEEGTCLDPSCVTGEQIASEGRRWAAELLCCPPARKQPESNSKSRPVSAAGHHIARPGWMLRLLVSAHFSWRYFSFLAKITQELELSCM